MSSAGSFPPGGVSTEAMRKDASELRKALKPLVEKRRRARINHCLTQLRHLILPLMGKDKCGYSKLEKADILDMTLRFLTEVPQTPTNDATVRYREGYCACLQRVSAFLPRTSLDRDTCARVHDFIRQSLLSSVPACRACCARASSAPSPTPHERLLSRKWIEVPRREKRVSDTPVRVPDAPQAAAQSVWRPW